MIPFKKNKIEDENLDLGEKEYELFHSVLLPER